ncbi:RNA polymerase sigma-70 factor [Puteibacter caeruleilacunae]|nr:RNA polymerase sigma-70 factor [Puteibacter caeruleilacunae]
MVEYIRRQLRRGDGFEKLFDDYYPVMVVFASKLTGDRMVAEEVVQDVFVKFWQKKKAGLVKTSSKAYIYRSVYNRCMDLYRREKQSFVQADDIYDDSNLKSDFNDLIAEAELKERIENAILELAPQTERIFRMSREEQLSYREIAEQLDVSVKTVENQVGRALKHLKYRLRNYL